MRGVLLLIGLWTAALLPAEDLWTLRTGPTSVDSIPLDPVQPVSAWRGQYSDGVATVWVYATRSPQFFAPRSTDVVAVPPTPWTVAVFFPGAWTPVVRSSWLALWTAEFRRLATLPEPGFPIVFPSVLRKP